MINIKDIRVRDYLRVNRDVCIKKGTIVEVRGIDADNRFENHIGCASCHPLDDNQFDGGIWCDFLDPIPLTPEILEKNGFRYTNQYTLKGADTYVLCLEQRGFDFMITIKLNDYFALDSYDDRMYRLAEIQTGKWYVHDLQHALRLCGIEKEIVL